MQKPELFADIFLHPGEFYFGGRNTRIRTVLGSCIAITLWHPRLRIGGMCHYLLPMCQKKVTEDLDGRYATDAMQLFIRELHKSKTFPVDYEAKVFGGGDQFPHQSQTHAITVPSKNITIGRSLLKQQGFNIKAEHLGGTGHRNIVFDVWSGEVWVRHVANTKG